ncbi:MAG: hypothetical protein BWK72_06040 [Rhodoferax ferrireducens]|uniref:Uncharacterized protein n=1 Tax=Rhodoferax ferrireducens TaxID=192843 RepID=A0A1W9KXV3_9BURK|nr:MAG: hypothetical protein BWK72_06040 [Rhodoferax ferrireducens]
MDPLLESELAQAAKRRGITKSQFIVEAVERALGRNNPGELYLKVMQDMASYTVAAPDGASAEALSPTKTAIQQSLRARHARGQADYAEYLKAKGTAAGGAA